MSVLQKNLQNKVKWQRPFLTWKMRRRHWRKQRRGRRKLHMMSWMRPWLNCRCSTVSCSLFPKSTLIFFQDTPRRRRSRNQVNAKLKRGIPWNGNGGQWNIARNTTKAFMETVLSGGVPVQRHETNMFWIDPQGFWDLLGTSPWYNSATFGGLSS